MEKIIKENIVKNIFVIIMLAILYFPIKNFLLSIGPELEKNLGSILATSSIIAVTACFGNFAFTYEKINLKSLGQRLLAHLTTGLFMLVIGISLIFTVVLTSMAIGKFLFFDATMVVLYIACVCYDLWDAMRIVNK